MAMSNILQNVKQKIFTLHHLGLFAGFVLFGLTAVGISLVAPKVYAGECDSNAILYCGFTSNSGFVNTVKANRDGLGHTDLQAIYAHTGLGSGDYDRFSSSAKSGTAYRDGRVVVDGQTVMTNTLSYGRNNIGGSAYSINGKTYYRGTPDQRWASGRQSFDVKVLFDSTGTAQFTVINVCGNPLTGTKVTSSATCNVLQKSPVAGKQNTYSFTTQASATGNAKLTKYVYNFGDGTAAVTTTSASAPVTHTYTKPGSYTASVTVYASVPGGNTISSSTQTCKQSIRVESPNITIEKKVDGVKTKTVGVEQEFTYELLIKNNGTQALSNAVVKDPAPANVLFLRADKGTVSKDGKNWTYTIPSLPVGGTATVKITAKVVAYTDQSITNKACVNAPEVNPGNPGVDDACDTAVVNVPKPTYECSKLSGPLMNGQTMGYRFTAESKTTNGAVLKRALFVFGDGQTRTVNANSGSSTITTDYIYEKTGKYSAYATLYFDVYGTERIAAFNCYAKVEPTKPAVPECKPGIPVGDIRCNPCEYDASIPKDDPRCVAPAATLPNTGAGNIIALASAALVGGFLWYRHILFRRHKRAYLAADLGASPLPLAEPLESPDPLAATPLAPQTRGRFSMRRRRQY